MQRGRIASSASWLFHRRYTPFAFYGELPGLRRSGSAATAGSTAAPGTD